MRALTMARIVRNLVFPPRSGQLSSLMLVTVDAVHACRRDRCTECSPSPTVRPTAPANSDTDTNALTDAD